jgi:hypothetical protein
MASWKKMAEAFGRAMSGVHVPNDAKNPAQKMVRDVHRSQTERNLERKIATDGWGGKNDPGIDEYRKGQDDLPRQPEFDRTKDYTSDSEHRGAVIDAMTDRDLQNDFDKAFEDAASHGSSELRARAIEMLKRGEPIPDVLDMLKWGN